MDHGNRAILYPERREYTESKDRSVQIMAMLPLKTLSRLWGRFNAIEIPYHLRVPGFTLYSWIFGVKYVASGAFDDLLPLLTKHPAVSQKYQSQTCMPILTLRRSSTGN